MMEQILLLLLGMAVGVMAGYVVARRQGRSRMTEWKAEAARQLEAEKAEAEKRIEAEKTDAEKRLSE